MTGRRVGYVGLDHHHAEPYLATLETLPATVTCACEPNPEFDVGTVESLGEVPIYRDLQDLLASETVDAVFLTLSNRDTPAAIERAVDEGVDVYTEKPAARTAAELEPLRDRIEGSDTTVCVSYPWQSHPIALELASLFEQGFFGTVRGFDARFVASQLAFRDSSHFVFDADASRGGIVQWLGIHWIQLLTWLLDGSIVRVNAAIRSGCPAVDVEDGATVQFETDDGALGSLTCGYYLREGLYDTRLDVYGEKGRSSWDPMGREFGFDGETVLELDDASGEWESTPHRRVVHDYEPTPGYGGAWGRSFVRAFFEACDDGADPPVTLDDALVVLRVLDAIYESAERDRWVGVERT